MPQPMFLPDVLLTGPSSLVSAPSWMKALPHSTRTADQLRALSKLPSMTVVQASGPGDVLSQKAFLNRLVTLHEGTRPAKILFCFSEPEMEDMGQGTLILTRLLARFPRVGDVECTHADGAFAMQEVMAKLAIDATRSMIRPLSSRSAPRPGARPHPLDEVKRVVQSTAALRASSGRLEAGKIAQALNLSVAELSSLMGRSRQTVSKTPDAESLQAPLREYARIARLLSVLPPKDLRAWLNLPNAQLDNRSPLQAVRAGQVGPVADLADDMLTGAPS